MVSRTPAARAHLAAAGPGSFVRILIILLCALAAPLWHVEPHPFASALPIPASTHASAGHAAARELHSSAASRSERELADAFANPFHDSDLLGQRDRRPHGGEGSSLADSHSRENGEELDFDDNFATVLDNFPEGSGFGQDTAGFEDGLCLRRLAAVLCVPSSLPSVRSVTRLHVYFTVRDRSQF